MKATEPESIVPRVLFVIDGLQAGGKERRLVELLKAIVPDKGIEAELIVMREQIFYKDVLDLGIPIHYVVRRYRKDPSPLWRLYAICRGFRPDIVHVWDSMSAVYAVIPARLVGARFINGMITDADPAVRPFTKLYVRSRITFPFSTVIVANSRAGISAYCAPDRKSLVIHNGIDLYRSQTLVPPDVVRREYGIETENVVGMVAAFSRWKDWPTFLAAATSIAARRHDVTFLAIGAGNELDTCKAMVSESCRGRVKFLGSQKNVESLVNIFDVGVLATFTEGISNSIMEYMLLRKPVVATRCEGTEELVREGETGFLVKRSDPEQLAHKVEALLDNRDLATRIGTAGYELIRSAFTIDKMADSFLRLYRKLRKQKTYA